MKSKYLSILFVAIIIFIQSSCNNEVDIYDENYKDVPVVYGLLNQTDSNHYLKITKTYQTDGNIILAAADNEKSQYRVGDLEVWIDEYNANDIFQRSIHFDTTLITNKDTGIFYSPNQIVYKAENIELNNNNLYELSIRIKGNENLINSKTNLIRDFSITNPAYGREYEGFSSSYPRKIEWRSAVNGLIYEVYYRFFYTEVKSSQSSSHYVDWYLGKTRSDDDKGGEELNMSFFGDGFFDYLSATIPPAGNGTVRYSDSLHLIINVGDEVLTTYMDINKPSNSIIQDKPQYTNITNGIGIFASRYEKVRRFKGLTQKTIDSLNNGYRTKDLGFESRPF